MADAGVRVNGFDRLAQAERLAVLDALARTALGAYDLPAETDLTLVNLSENATYRVEARADGRRWALRIHRDGYHSRRAIGSELAWAVALRQAGVAVTPVPLPGRDGALIQTADHPCLARPRHVVLFAWEAGAEPGVGEDLRRPFAMLGEVTARMHIHARAWARPPGFERFTWGFSTTLGAAPHWGRWRDGMGVTPARAALFQRTVDVIGRRLAAFGAGPERFGLVHGDLRLANLLMDGDEVKVIDFDDCGFSWFMYDAATPLSFYEHHPNVPELIAHWLEGYRRVLDLSAAEEAEIPTFLMLRRLLLVAWIGSHADTDLARSMGVDYTAGSEALCEAYLGRFG